MVRRLVGEAAVDGAHASAHTHGREHVLQARHSPTPKGPAPSSQLCHVPGDALFLYDQSGIAFTSVTTSITTGTAAARALSRAGRMSSGCSTRMPRHPIS